MGRLDKILSEREDIILNFTPAKISFEAVMIWGGTPGVDVSI